MRCRILRASWISCWARSTVCPAARTFASTRRHSAGSISFCEASSRPGSVASYGSALTSFGLQLNGADLGISDPPGCGPPVTSLLRFVAELLSGHACLVHQSTFRNRENGHAFLIAGCLRLGLLRRGTGARGRSLCACRGRGARRNRHCLRLGAEL